ALPISPAEAGPLRINDGTSTSQNRLSRRALRVPSPPRLIRVSKAEWSFPITRGGAGQTVARGCSTVSTAIYATVRQVRSASAPAGDYSSTKARDIESTTGLAR